LWLKHPLELNFSSFICFKDPIALQLNPSNCPSNNNSSSSLHLRFLELICFLSDCITSLSLSLLHTHTSCRQFHQHYTLAFFVRTSFRQLFYTYVRTYVSKKKAAETTFVRKTRAFNVDEIDTCTSPPLALIEWGDESVYLDLFRSKANSGDISGRKGEQRSRAKNQSDPNFVEINGIRQKMVTTFFCGGGIKGGLILHKMLISFCVFPGHQFTCYILTVIHRLWPL